MPDYSKYFEFNPFKIARDDKIKLPTDTWRELPGQKGPKILEFSPDGKVRNQSTKTILNIQTTYSGYKRLICGMNWGCCGLELMTIYVHHAIALMYCFNPDPNNYNTVDHINRKRNDKTNRRKAAF